MKFSHIYINNNNNNKNVTYKALTTEVSKRYKLVSLTYLQTLNYIYMYMNMAFCNNQDLRLHVIIKCADVKCLCLLHLISLVSKEVLSILRFRKKKILLQKIATGIFLFW